MKKSILYLGDTELKGAASYLAGVLTHYGIGYDYLSSDEKFHATLLQSDYRAIVISDYRAANFTPEHLACIAERVRDGMGILMIGGWESFTGTGGDYNRTVLADVLPVVMAQVDDRVNFSGPCIVKKVAEHEIINSLDFDGDAPTIGGLNSFKAKDSGMVILQARSFRASHNAGEFHFKAKKTYPLLVLGGFGGGNTAAFASDAAPHWVGPFVDWGKLRIHTQAKGAQAIEIGENYAKFFANLICWTAKENFRAD